MRALLILTFLLGLGLANAATAGLAFAQDALASAKAAGLVGEQPDGLVGAVSGASGDIQALINQVNGQRMAQYQSVAQSNGIPVGQVQAIAGAKLIEATPGGQFVRNAAGSWVQK